MSKLLSYFLSYQFILSVIIFFCGMALWILQGKFSAKYKQTHWGENGINIQFLDTIFRFCLSAIILIVILQIHGVNVGSLAAGLGIAGITVGFALQDYLKDFLMGFNIAWDHFFVVGDIIKYKTLEGKPVIARVTDFNLKVTKLCDIDTGNTFTVCNRNISEIEVVSTFLAIEVPAPYEIEAQRMREICQDLAEQAGKLENVESCRFAGTREFADSQISYLLIVHCPPEVKGQTRRDILGLIQDRYAEENIEIPYSQLVIHDAVKK